MKTVKITVPAAFKFTDSQGVQKEFAPGVHDVTPDVAEHWYVKAHSTPVDKEAAKNASAEKAAAEKAEAERKAAEEEAARKAAEDAAKNGGKK